MAFIDIKDPIKREETVKDYIKISKKFEKDMKMKKCAVYHKDKI